MQTLFCVIMESIRLDLSKIKNTGKSLNTWKLNHKLLKKKSLPSLVVQGSRIRLAGHGAPFEPWWGTIPRAAGQSSPGVTATEPEL